MVPILCNYARAKPSSNSYIQEGLANLSYGARPDADSFDKDVGKIIQYSPSASCSFPISIYTSYTWFTIPYKQFNSSTDEDLWIEATIRILFDEMRNIMLSDTFQKVMFNVNERFAEKVFDKNRTTNLPKFLRKAVVKSSKVAHLTNHVITSVARNITTDLYVTRLAKRKYPDANDVISATVRPAVAYESGDDVNDEDE